MSCFCVAHLIISMLNYQSLSNECWAAICLAYIMLSYLYITALLLYVVASQRSESEVHTNEIDSVSSTTPRCESDPLPLPFQAPVFSAGAAGQGLEKLLTFQRPKVSYRKARIRRRL